MTTVPRDWWVEHEASQFYAGCAQRFWRHSPLIENLQRIFSALTETLMTLGNYRHGAHVFINRTLPEAHVLMATDADEIPKYEPVVMTEQRELYIELRQQLEKRDGPGVPAMAVADAATIARFGSLLGKRIDDPSHGLIIAFDFHVVNLGVFVLWGHGDGARDPSHAEDTWLAAWVAKYYSFLSGFLQREFTITDQTYLPSFYSVRWAPATILFADIREFTPLTEILRNTQTTIQNQSTAMFQDILHDYCEAMASIIQEEAGGRIDKFLGDGIMAIFGEHVTDPAQSVCRAVYAACLMVTRFAQLRDKFLKRAFGGEYEIEYNEAVDIRLGIGINYGTVLFEYLGDQRHREYTAIGDHVNFAQRLESAAARVDPQTGIAAPPILISPTAERCARPWLGATTPVKLNPKGKGRYYTVYGVDPAAFDYRLYETSIRTKEWVTPWRKETSPLMLRAEGSTRQM